MAGLVDGTMAMEPRGGPRPYRRLQQGLYGKGVHVPTYHLVQPFRLRPTTSGQRSISELTVPQVSRRPRPPISSCTPSIHLVWGRPLLATLFIWLPIENFPWSSIHWQYNLKVFSPPFPSQLAFLGNFIPHLIQPALTHVSSPVDSTSTFGLLWQGS